MYEATLQISMVQILITHRAPCTLIGLFLWQLACTTATQRREEAASSNIAFSIFYLTSIALHEFQTPPERSDFTRFHFSDLAVLKGLCIFCVRVFDCLFGQIFYFPVFLSWPWREGGCRAAQKFEERQDL